MTWVRTGCWIATVQKGVSILVGADGAMRAPGKAVGEERPGARVPVVDAALTDPNAPVVAEAAEHPGPLRPRVGTFASRTIFPEERFWRGKKLTTRRDLPCQMVISSELTNKRIKRLS